jgi:hypothetical protein
MKNTALLVAAGMLVLTPAQAMSEIGGQWEIRQVGKHKDGRPHYARVYCRSDGRCYRPQRRAQAPANPARVYGFVQRHGLDDGASTCREVRRAVGDQHLTVDGAKKAANDAWAGTVRFHLGEKFMDLANARQVSYTCSRSSIKEGGVTTLGQTLTRCEIEAQPCHPQREGGEK